MGLALLDSTCGGREGKGGAEGGKELEKQAEGNASAEKRNESDLTATESEEGSSLSAGEAYENASPAEREGDRVHAAFLEVSISSFFFAPPTVFCNSIRSRNERHALGSRCRTKSCTPNACWLFFFFLVSSGGSLCHGSHDTQGRQRSDEDCEPR